MNININERAGLNITDFQFLSAFKDKNENVYFRLIKETEKGTAFSLNCKLTINSKDEYPLIQQFFVKHQKEGFGIFFVVNSGGSKKQSITQITSHFLDMDFGKVTLLSNKNEVIKDMNGKVVYYYRSKEEIEKYKRNFLITLSTFALSPSIVVETKNGFHVYWLVDKSKSQDLSLFTPIQNELIKFFGNLEERKEHSDQRVKTLERVQRIINYNHLKNPHDPFLIKCIFFNPNLIYSQEDILKSINVDFSQLKLINDKLNKKNNNPQKETSICKISSNTIINKINRNEIDYKEIFHYLKTEINLGDYLGITGYSLGQNFSCLFHTDNHPSANISVDSDGSYRYFCNSSNCQYSSDKGLDIIDIVKFQMNLNTNGALKYLTDIYNIKIIDSQWKQRESDKYAQNLKIISNYKEFKLEYPYLSRLLRYCLSLIHELISIANNSIQSRFFLYDNNSVFFTSNRFLSKKTKKNLTRTNQYVNLLCILGFINKISTEKIPKTMITKANALARQNHQNRISFYTIPNFSNILDVAEVRAKLMIENRFTINSMSKKCIENIFGVDFADSIYHIQINHSKTGEEIRQALENIILKHISSLGYTHKDMILSEKVIINGNYICYSSKKYELGRLLPDLLQKYDWICIKANKKINTALNIDTKKYLIVKRNLIN